MKKNVNFDKFYDFKVNHCDKFFPSDIDTWSLRVLIACMNDEELLEKVQKYIDIPESITAIELDKIMQELRDETNKYILKCKDKVGDDLYNNFSTALVYYGLLESLDELASFANNLLDQIRNKYGDNYLYVISQFDKGNLSVDTAKIANRELFDNIDYNDELLKKYAVLKEWQDKQHGYYQTIIEPLLMEIEEKYREEHQLPIDVDIEDFFEYKKFYELSHESIISLDEIAKFMLCGVDKELIKLIGGKAYGLSVLKSENIEIPLSYVVPTLNSEVDNLDLKELNQSINYSVRSSADIEDGNKNSFAGMFDSYLNIPHDKLIEYTKKVVDSKNNDRLQKYIETNKLDQPNMAVVIQKFVEPEYAGVWIGQDKSSGYLEYVEGNGEKLVSGKITPNREAWSNNKCHSKTLKCSEGEIGKLLIEYQSRVAKNENDTADFEWMVLDNHLVMLQYRPVTSKINIIDDVEKDQVIRGIPASPGKVTAPCRFVNARYINQLDDWNNGDILLSWFTDPEWMNILSNSSGIVTAVGGFLCHAAIIARELGIPCVIGIGPSAMKKIWEEEALTIDGDKGTVEVVKTKKKLR